MRLFKWFFNRIAEDYKRYGPTVWVVPMVAIVLTISIWFASYGVASNVETVFGITSVVQIEACESNNLLREQVNENIFRIEVLSREESLDDHHLFRLDYLDLVDCESLFENGFSD